MLFAGFAVERGDQSLVPVVVMGVLGNLVGSWIAYAVGYYGRVDVLEKHGKKLHIRPKDLDSAFAIICDNDDVEFPEGSGA